MSHGLDKVGSGMFCVKEPAWHNHPSCTVLTEAPDNVDDAINHSKANFLVRKEPNYLLDGRLSGSFSLVRTDNNAILTGVKAVGPQYTVVQNHYKFKWFQPFLDAKEAVLESAGVLNGGEKVWVMCKLNRDPMVISKGDEIIKYLLLSDSFDGTTSIRVGFTPQRVVCQNTLQMAHSAHSSQLIRVKHNLQVEKNLENIRETINAIDAQFEATAEQYKLLAARGINQKDLKKYIKKVFEMEEKEDKKGVKRLSTRTENILLEVMGLYNQQYNVEKVEELMETGQGSQLVSAKGTLWGAYNSISNYLTHTRGQTIDTRLESLWFGSSAKLNERALTLALQAV